VPTRLAKSTPGDRLGGLCSSECKNPENYRSNLLSEKGLSLSTYQLILPATCSLQIEFALAVIFPSARCAYTRTAYVNLIRDPELATSTGQGIL